MAEQSPQLVLLENMARLKQHVLQSASDQDDCLRLIKEDRKREADVVDLLTRLLVDLLPAVLPPATLSSLLSLVNPSNDPHLLAAVKGCIAATNYFNSQLPIVMGSIKALTEKDALRKFRLTTEKEPELQLTAHEAP